MMDGPEPSSSLGENLVLTAHLPSDIPRCVDGGFYVAAVKVSLLPLGDVIDPCQEPENIRHAGAGGGDVVHVEAGVEAEGGF